MSSKWRKQTLGENVLGDEIVDHLRRAMQYRGRVARGHFEPEDGDDFETFIRSIYALEAFCYLLTIRDLPMSAEGAKRTLRQQLVSDYQRYPG